MGRGQSSYNPGSVLNPYGGRGDVNNMPVNPIPTLGDFAGQFPRPAPQYPGLDQPMPAPIGPVSIPGSKSGMGGQPAGPFTRMPQMGSIPGLPIPSVPPMGSTPGLPPMMESLPNTPQMGSIPSGFRDLSQMGSIPGTREADMDNQFANLVNGLRRRGPNFAMNNALRGLGQGGGLSDVAQGIERDSYMGLIDFNSPQLDTMRYGNRPLRTGPRYGHGGQMMPQYARGGQVMPQYAEGGQVGMGGPTMGSKPGLAGAVDNSKTVNGRSAEAMNLLYPMANNVQRSGPVAMHVAEAQLRPWSDRGLVGSGNQTRNFRTAGGASQDRRGRAMRQMGMGLGNFRP